METDYMGVKMSTLKSNLLETEKLLQGKLGTDFEITPESVIGNIAVIIARLNKKIEEKIAFLTKQFSPYSADGGCQNALYERVGVYRVNARPTTFCLKVYGEKEKVFAKNSLLIQSNLSDDFFVNSEEFTIDDAGSAEVKFSSLISSNIEVLENETFKIVRPAGVNLSVSTSLPYNIVLGNPFENDIEFRERFEKSFEKNNYCTRNCNLNYLRAYVEHPNFLKIYDCKTDGEISPGQLLVLAKPAVSNKDFAKKIFDCTQLGLQFLGNISEEIPLSNGQNFEMKFQKAAEIPLKLSIEINLKDGVYQSDVSTNLKTKIVEFFNGKFFGFNSTVNSYEFVYPSLAVNGIEGVVQVRVCKKSDTNLNSFVTVGKFEIPTLNEDDIEIIYL